jgi:hypothetical protein
LTVVRYYNNDWNTYPEEYRQFLGQFFLAQIDGFEAGTMLFSITFGDNCSPRRRRYMNKNSNVVVCGEADDKADSSKLLVFTFVIGQVQWAGVCGGGYQLG